MIENKSISGNFFIPIKTERPMNLRPEGSTNIKVSLWNLQISHESFRPLTYYFLTNNIFRNFRNERLSVVVKPKYLLQIQKRFIFGIINSNICE